MVTNGCLDGNDSAVLSVKQQGRQQLSATILYEEQVLKEDTLRRLRNLQTMKLMKTKACQQATLPAVACSVEVALFLS